MLIGLTALIIPTTTQAAPIAGASEIVKVLEMKTADVETKEVEEETKKKQVDKEDVDLLARLIYSESGVLGKKGMRYTGSVVLNRVKSKKYPNTLYGVIYQSGQYAVTWNGGINTTPSKKAYKIARSLLRNGSVLPAKVVYQAEFVQGKGVYTIVGNTYYCY